MGIIEINRLGRSSILIESVVNLLEDGLQFLLQFWMFKDQNREKKSQNDDVQEDNFGLRSSSSEKSLEVSQMRRARIVDDGYNVVDHGRNGAVVDNQRLESPELSLQIFFAQSKGKNFFLLREVISEQVIRRQIAEVLANFFENTLRVQHDMMILSWFEEAQEIDRLFVGLHRCDSNLAQVLFFMRIFDRKDFVVADKVGALSILVVFHFVIMISFGNDSHWDEHVDALFNQVILLPAQVFGKRLVCVDHSSFVAHQECWISKHFKIDIKGVGGFAEQGGKHYGWVIIVVKKRIE